MGNYPDSIPISLLQRFGLFLARSCISAWVGAASLFVVVGIIEVTQGGFDSATKDSLVVLRFPAYYVFGVALVSTGWIGTCLAGSSSEFSGKYRIGVIAVLSLVLACMIVDYIWIYLPLAQMVTPPGQSKPAIFVQYHQASKWINLVGLKLCLIAIGLLNWPAYAVRRDLLAKSSANSNTDADSDPIKTSD